MKFKVVLCVTTALLSACGGGGDGEDSAVVTIGGLPIIPVTPTVTPAPTVTASSSTEIVATSTAKLPVTNRRIQIDALASTATLEAPIVANVTFNSGVSGTGEVELDGLTPFDAAVTTGGVLRVIDPDGLLAEVANGAGSDTRGSGTIVGFLSNHASFGFWSRAVSTSLTRVDLGMYHAGLQTPAARAVPSGTVVFEGTAIGVVLAKTAISSTPVTTNLAGDLSLRVEPGGAVNGTIESDGTALGFNPITLTGTLTGATYEGTVTVGSGTVPLSSAQRLEPRTTGTFEGALYGFDATETAGTLSAEDTDTVLVMGFAGVK